MRHRRRQDYREHGDGGLELTALGDVRISGRIGEGVSCVVYRGCWRGRDVALKLYKAGAIERHFRLLGGDLAEFEYRRNRDFYHAAGLSRYVAEPLAYLASGGVAAFVQEYLDGELYYHYHRHREGRVPEGLSDHVRRIVELAHEAGLYDVDLHAGNVIVVEQPGGEAIPKLFDFNFIPFYVHPPNPLAALLLKFGVIDLRSRDLRKLERFHDFRRVERTLRRFGGVKGAD